jgi:hypothetical protein
MILQLNNSHKELVRDLFINKNYMGVPSSQFGITNPDNFMEANYEFFCDSYLSGLKTFKAFGNVEDSKITAVIAFYESPDSADWYWTQVRSKDSESMRKVSDAVIEYNEANGRYKFYSLFNHKYINGIRKFAYSDINNMRYDFVDEFFIPAKTRCVYNMPWQILFNRTLLPVDTVVRCSFLKQQYRIVPIAGKDLGEMNV